MLKTLTTVASVALPIEERWSIKRCRYAPDGESVGRVCIATGTHGDEMMGQLIVYLVQQRIAAHPDALRGTGFAELAGQAENSILPGYVGIETSQSAFGDTYAWLKRLLLWPLESLLAGSGLPQEQQNALAQQAGQQLLPLLEQSAKALPPQPELVALDWFNGRRYPYNNDQASSAVCGLDLGVSAPVLYRALVEATAYGQRRIVTGLTEHGIRIDRIVAVGGIAQKSPFVMQTLSDVLQRPITVSPVSQTCALGAAIYASVGAGLYASVEQAQAAICRPCRTIYQPDPTAAAYHAQKYQRYCELCRKTDASSFPD